MNFKFNTLKKPLSILGSMLTILLLACNENQETAFSIIPPSKKIESVNTKPKEETVYVFPYRTNVRIENLECNYLIQDDFNDLFDEILRKNLPAVDINKQNEFGEFFHNNIIPFQVIDKHPVQKKLNEICDKMEKFLPIKIDFKVVVISSPHPNAFKTVGNYIYLTTGLIEQLQTDDALAYVIGHEIGHFENGNISDHARVINYCMSKQNELENNQKSNKVFGNIAQFGLLAAYVFTDNCLSKADEIESDLIGFYLCYKAGYNPETAMEALHQMLEWEGMPLTNTIKRIKQDILRTHPPTIDRITCASDYINKSKIEVRCQKEYSPNSKVELLKKVNLFKYPSIYSEVVKENFFSKNNIKPVCYFLNQHFANTEFDEWVFINDIDGNQGWVLEKYLKVN